jgi:MoaA/NifB/PqqE/SkfB family radical SAM enzyme
MDTSYIMSETNYDQWLNAGYNKKQHTSMFTTERLQHSNYLRINFQPGNICTYDCTYCPKGAKAGDHGWPDPDRLKQLIDRIHAVYTQPPYNKDCIIYEWLGGEVTLWKHFPAILSHVVAIGDRNALVTNGVRSLNWWSQFGNDLDHITLSYHSEFSDVEHVTAVMNQMSDRGISVWCLVLMYPVLWERCVSAISYMQEHGRWGGITPFVVNYSSVELGKAWPSYEQQHWDWFAANPRFMTNQKSKNELSKNIITKTLYRDSSTGSIKWQPPEQLIQTQRNSWQGWHCMIGIDTLGIERNGNVRPDMGCRAGPSIGNWLHDDIDELVWPTEPVHCPKSQCFCVHDMHAR